MKKLREPELKPRPLSHKAIAITTWAATMARSLRFGAICRFLLFSFNKLVFIIYPKNFKTMFFDRESFVSCQHFISVLMSQAATVAALAVLAATVAGRQR